MRFDKIEEYTTYRDKDTEGTIQFHSKNGKEVKIQVYDKRGRRLLNSEVKEIAKELIKEVMLSRTGSTESL